VSVNVSIKRTITVNGKDYNSIDELPPDVRALYAAAMERSGKKVTVKKITINGVDIVQTRSSRVTIVIVVLAVLAGIAFALYRAF
jgi:hypothetical protein